MNLSASNDVLNSSNSPAADIAEANRRVTAREEYQSRLEHARGEIARMKSQHLRMVWVRTLLFILALVCLFLGYAGDSFRTLFLSVGWLSAAAFFVAIVRHEYLRLSMLRHESDERLFDRLLGRLDRDWSRVSDQQLLPEFSNAAFADDLDVAGNASLLSLLSLAGTLPGRRKIQGWLSHPTSWNEVRLRQHAIKALIPERGLRLSIIQTVLACSNGSEDVYGLPKWAGSAQWLPRHRVAHALSYLGPSLVISGAALLAVAAYLAQGSTPVNAAADLTLVNLSAGLMGAGFLINILITVFWGSWIHEIFHQVTGQHQATFQFADVFSSFSRLPTDGGLLDEIRRVATRDASCARVGFEKLLWTVRLANLQRDPMLYIVYLILQLILVWDFRILKLLEQWKVRFGGSVEHWFEALGTCEALISGATLADEYPSWAFPEPPTPGFKLSTTKLGHPLLPDASRVLNDLSLDDAQPLLLVTGSNMAGKSTFLRAVGLNLLLARTGSPVCAMQLSTPLYDLATSIRVRDSLRDGVSFFMAELKRLKEVVDLAHARADGSGAPILFLLDEILQGTNSRERQLAVATVVEQLIRYGAAGLLSTHDLDLATVDEIQRVSQIVHFREYFENVAGAEVMRFDYKMRAGPTPTTNALKLLKMVGLDTATIEPPQP